MKCELICRAGDWSSVLDSARTTVNKPPIGSMPTREFKYRMLMSEHSPIRNLSFRARWTELPYWVSVHLVRHKHGIEHFVSTQREDRTGVPRNDRRQGDFVTHEILVNAQAVINISRKRLCKQAAPETRMAWQLFLAELNSIEPELFNICVPDCVYRNSCFEPKSCGYSDRKDFSEARYIYTCRLKQEEV